MQLCGSRDRTLPVYDSRIKNRKAKQWADLQLTRQGKGVHGIETDACLVFPSPQCIDKGSVHFSWEVVL